MIEMFNLSFMVMAFWATLIMGLLLSYLGIHVIGRGIVFVDLALGQISSLGVAFSQFTHVGEEWLPIVFTLVGAVLLSLIHVEDKRLRLEAIIGIIYVVAAATTVLIISKTPHGEADIQEVLFGTLLATSSTDLLKLGIVFAVLAILHVAFQKHIFRITERMEAGEVADFGVKERAWNFFFYLSIGLAIVYAVRIGGVMPVFSYLVVPAVSAVLVARRTWVIITITLFNSVIAGFFGLWFSYTFDFPAGPSIVAIFGVICLGAAVVRFLQNKTETHNQT